ncbi:HPr family phosphocarrier protein [Paenibacillus sp. P96]|uniref:HPr family phosphocarrier protein n=1 Tax=Paenibacillus zeirhizosphaerae TaxID=2987519 RepID=A0ABT9FR80_9BACL|nr:HPr family phosphocarrier protein [Paenibacillus sp. P96]MDP4097225.1 HPr family phosphocarrier protein [Paenibacillus sp. P96]
MRVHEFSIKQQLSRDQLVHISSEASRFSSNITITFNIGDAEHRIDVKSLLGMMLMIVAPGSSIRLTAAGEDDLEALEYLVPMLEGSGQYLTTD